MAFKPIYFLILLLIAVLEQVQTATQLRLVNGLLIIEDRQSPLSMQSGSHDLPEHGYLNRTSSRRLLKDARAAATAAIRNRSIKKILQASTTPIDEVALSIENSVTETHLSTKIPEVLTTSVAIEKKAERDIPATTAIEKDKKDLDANTDNKDTSTSFTHTTAVNSVTSPTMDVITIIWYFSTFVALIAFFVVMVCSDKYCGRSTEKPEESTVSPPATPAPSYREFAPPSYDSVMRKYKNRVFIIPMLDESGELKVPGDTTTTVELANPGTIIPTTPTMEQRSIATVRDSEDNSQRRANESSTSVSPPSKTEGETPAVVLEVIDEIHQAASSKRFSVNSGGDDSR